MPARISFVTGTYVSDRLERLKVGSTGNFTFNNTQLFLQQSTGALSVGSISPHTSSMVDINSTNKGVLLPRMTTAQRDSISSPAAGLLIYLTDGSQGFYYYNGIWRQLNPSLSGFANTSLSNLSTPTAVNVDLLPATTAVSDLGSPSNNWRNIYLSGDVYAGATRFWSYRPDGNNFFGTSAGISLTSGGGNTASGFEALYYNATGYGNTANGNSALYSNTGDYNTATGLWAQESNTIGFANSSYGAYALPYNTTGVYNVA